MKNIVTESLISEMRVVDKDTNSPALCIMEGPCMEFDKVNRNNRIYSRKLIEDRILNNPSVQEAIKNKCMLGEGGHPESRIEISYPDVALCVEKLWIPKDSKNMLWGRFAILDTPVGHIIDTLVRYGSKIGISARAMTDSVERDGHEIISETNYDLITFDAVPDPGFKSARLAKVESAMRPMDSMTLPELLNASTSLKSARVPAFESRIRMLDKEIERRKSIDLGAEIQEIRSLLEHVKKCYSLSKVHEVEDLVSTSKSLIKETKHEMEVYNKLHNDYTEEIKRLEQENKSLQEEVGRLDNLLYQRSLSPDYSSQMEHLNSLVKRVESLNTNKQVRECKALADKFLIKESRMSELLSNTNEKSICLKDSRKIAQFEREPQMFLESYDSLEEKEDSLTRSIRAQVRR